MSIRTVNAISGRLSLRPPQRTSLEILDRVCEVVKPNKQTDLKTALEIIRSEYPTVTDFEREFPSLCFALATGVGKTRLMGAFIAYLHQERGLNDFFVLAPNLTIYNKLITDFTPNTAKYIFKGLGEFATEGVEVITGDNYEDGRGVRDEFLGGFREGIHINLFNIAKINTEVRGGKAPRMKRLRETIGAPYFDYLAGLEDLVLLMDESHRYRGSAGIKVLNELRPILGLELTATPQVEAGAKTIAFKNVIFSYPLTTAMADGFVKEPAVATRQNFRAEDYKDRPLDLERLKLEDGIRIHEDTKAELKVYSDQHDKPFVKPFMLIIARDVAHAETIVATIRKDDFFAGDYKDKVIIVHSTLSGEEKEETVAELLSVESPDNKTEIVVHVNMLKEGWDVTNLYTIVPLRKADSRTLVEQSIGRGLRLPFGQRTGVPAVDRLTIVAHEKFQDIIDEANKPGSTIHFKMAQVIVGKDVGVERKVTRHVAPTLFADIDEPAPASEVKSGSAADKPPIFADESERKLAHATITAIRELERDTKRVPTVSSLKSPANQAELARKVAASMAPTQMELTGLSEPPDIASIVAKATDLFERRTIGIPRIIVVPKGEVTSGFQDFDMDLKATRPQPVDHAILIQNLRNDERFVIDEDGLPETEERLEDYLVGRLVDYDDICYDEQADLLYKLAGQVVHHLRSYLADEEKVLNVLLYNLRMWVELIHAQMQKHRWTRAAGYEVSASRGFESLKDIPFTAIEEQAARDFREPPEPLHDVPKMLFTGFARCLYPIQKFGSDPERRFAVMLEDEKRELKWFKPARDQFRIYYRGDRTYEPDFVVETETDKLLCEPKRTNDMHDEDVQAKAKAALEWCRHATDHEVANGGKPWSYVLIPHDAITASANLSGLVAMYTVRG